MPRKTRAAARADDTHVEIAMDGTATLAKTPMELDIKGGDEDMPLGEVSANTAEQAGGEDMEPSTEEVLGKGAGKGTTKKGKTAKRTVKKAAAKDGPKQDKAVASPSVAEQGSKATPVASVAPVNSSDSPTMEEAVVPVPLAELEQQAEAPRVEEPQQLPSPDAAVHTEAAHRLESLFTGAKPDPIEAMDALEDALEKVDLALTPQKSKSRTTSKSPGKSATKSEEMSLGKSTDKVVGAKKSNHGRQPSWKRPPSIAPRTSMAASRIGGQRPSPSATKTSSKPPTKSTFQLPGEAVAAKLKAQREAREKRMEEAAEKRKQIAAAAGSAPTIRKPSSPTKPAPVSTVRKTTTPPKARSPATKPVSKKPVPEVRGTATSRARMSLAATGTKPGVTIKKPTAPAVDRATLANTARPRAPAKSDAAGAGPGGSKTVGKTGKEIFAREKQTREEQEQQLKEKAEAAKKARAEAAERGRTASREWAEKMKAKAAADKAAKAKMVEQASVDVEAKMMTA